MSLLKIYTNKTDSELIEILEKGQDYTKEARDAANTILEFRSVSEKEIKELAKEYWRHYLKDNIKNHLLLKNKPESYFLSKKEMIGLFKIAFKEWKENQQLFEIDTTQYWFV